jgi:hypothetical protein
MNAICTAASGHWNNKRAIDDVLSGVSADTNELSIVFCSARRDLGEISDHIATHWPTGNIVGCSSAGEITPGGYLSGAITAVGFPKQQFHAAVARIDNVRELALIAVTRAVQAIHASLEKKVESYNPSRCFALLLVDGIVGCEEKLVAALGAELRGIQLVGGSAANDWAGGSAKSSTAASVLQNGRFRENCAVLIVMQTALPWRIMSHNHYVATKSKAVITSAKPDERLVVEINGNPAASTYAHLCGMSRKPTAGFDFSAHPAMIHMGKQWFPRGILKLNPDDSIQFGCAIERGLVVAVGKPVSMVAKLNSAFAAIRAQIGPPALILGFDCAARMFYMNQNGLRPRISQMMQQNRVVGMSTIGEQYNTIHQNNSFTALAIGHA